MNIEIENDEKQPEKPPQRGIYLLPNLLTTSALFAGFYAIVAAMKGHFEVSAIAIFVAMIADSLDGRVARLTQTTSKFGAEYDSLSDMAAFGIAPALVVYSWSLSQLGKIGWLAAFLYAAATALRLARFNTQVSDKCYFQGLPSPAAAGVIASCIWMGVGYGVQGKFIAILLGILTVALAGLMVSAIRYSSFKSVDFRGKVPFITVVVAVFVLAAIAWEPTEILFGIFMLYILSGPVMTFWQMRKMRRLRLQEHKRG
jgi:CDP-diacylglycerol--serine O-phosphatidyltransferase